MFPAHSVPSTEANLFIISSQWKVDSWIFWICYVVSIELCQFNYRRATTCLVQPENSKMKIEIMPPTEMILLELLVFNEKNKIVWFPLSALYFSDFPYFNLNRNRFGCCFSWIKKLAQGHTTHSQQLFARTFCPRWELTSSKNRNAISSKVHQWDGTSAGTKYSSFYFVCNNNNERHRIELHRSLASATTLRRKWSFFFSDSKSN